MWMITCPGCGYVGRLEEYGPSCADECSCPKCEAFFEVDLSADEDADEDGEDLT